MGYVSIQSGKVYNIFRTSAEIELGSPAKYMGKPMIVVEAKAYLIDGDWQYDYVLKSTGECEIEILKNENLRGTSIKGTVINSQLGQVQLKLESDSEGETVESWHMQPAYYAGTGRGYGGRPEMGGYAAAIFCFGYGKRALHYKFHRCKSGENQSDGKS